VLIGSDAGPGMAGPNQFSDQGGQDGVLAMGWGSGTANMTYLVTVGVLPSSGRSFSHGFFDVIATGCNSAKGEGRSY
jgi:hypothetical protein